MNRRFLGSCVVASAFVLQASVAQGANTLQVLMTGITFSAPDLTVTVGDTVRWVWIDGFHNVESGVGGTHDGIFRSGDPTAAAGTTFELVFDQAFLDANPQTNNSYPYYCFVHVGVGMIGTITVVTDPQPWMTSGVDIYNTNTGNVGIGTATPVQKLEVVGSAIVFEPLNFAIAGVTETGLGVIGVAGSGGLAGAFVGDVVVTGNLSKAGGSFKIDHPLDPANKYLSHSFVESPDMMNVYNGNITTDRSGNAWVELPTYFGDLNRDFRYQLTVIEQFAQAIVGQRIQNNRFLIRTDKPNVAVSWQVTGIRMDAWANSNRITVEEMKDVENRGQYLHPELYDKSDESRMFRMNDFEEEKGIARKPSLHGG